MERLSKKDIKADQTFDKVLKEHVVKKNRKTLSIMIRGSRAVLSGEEEAVKLAHENMENLTVEELLESMTNTESDGDLKFMTTEKVKFPPMLGGVINHQSHLPASPTYPGVPVTHRNTFYFMYTHFFDK